MRYNVILQYITKERPMKNISIVITSVLLNLALSGCETANLAIPPSLEAKAVQYPIDGLSGLNFKRNISVADVSGTYRQDSDQLTIAGYENKRAKAYYNVDMGGNRVIGSCRMEQGKAVIYADDAIAAIQAAVIADDVYKPMHYACHLSGTAVPSQAEFVLKEVEGNRLHVGGFQETERYGHVRWNNTLLGIKSSHVMKSKSGKLSDTHSLFAPAEGYIISRGNDPVAVVDLSGKETLHMDPNVNPEEREAILVAAISLGLHRDPAEMADNNMQNRDDW